MLVKIQVEGNASEHDKLGLSSVRFDGCPVAIF